MADLLRYKETADVADLGWARFPETEDRIPYGRFRNVYLYITEECQLRCKHCYMGERLERALAMPVEDVRNTLLAWRQLGGSKLTLLGGEPTLHPQFEKCVEVAYSLGYEKIILTTNGLKTARTKISAIPPKYLNYVQVSLDGGSSESHDNVRGKNTFKYSIETSKKLVELGHDVRFICTVNRANRYDVMKLLENADDIGATLVKFHVFSTIGTGGVNDELAMLPHEWLDFTDELQRVRQSRRGAQIWYQPTYARRQDLELYKSQGYRGCVGRTMDRISIFPDGRCYICSFLFDTDLHFAEMVDGHIVLNRKANEFDLFLGTLTKPACGNCGGSGGCGGGCPAEKLVDGDAACNTHNDIVSICRLWKADVK